MVNMIATANNIAYCQKFFLLIFLNLSGGNDALTDDGRGLAGLHLRELGEGHGLYFTMDVDTAGDYRVRFSFVNSCHAN